ncbi:heterokaryon incompatibility, partial [Alternaria alternata]
CELVSNADEQGPSYVGLSYAWGDAQIRRPILVGNKVFHATENLAVALEHLQEKDKTITFWIDAICIDQSNSNEKSVQVQRMGDIFASAVVVIAWIGLATED